jgi:hypothetical protein
MSQTSRTLKVLDERPLGRSAENATTPRDAFMTLSRILGVAPSRTPQFEGSDPIVPTPFRVATAASAALGLAAAAANEIWRLRGGTQQDITVNLSAAATSLRAFALLKRDGEFLPWREDGKPAMGFYRGGCGDWIRIHGAFAHDENRTLDLLNAANSREAVANAVAKWSVPALEDALAFMGQCGAAVRREQEWKKSPQGAALGCIPPIVLKRTGDAPVLRLPDCECPLDGVRVLDVTRLLAGPVVGRTLASHGAEVLSIRSRKLPTIDAFDLDTGAGKRSAFLEFSEPGGAEQLRALARQAHIFVDSYRPGTLAQFGITPAALAHCAPGIVYVTVSCYGHQGAWAGRKGWDAVVQAATGIAAEQGAFVAERAGRRRDVIPQLIPAAVLDYATGYLAAAGAVTALLRRYREGGSWIVCVSLAATALWLMSLGRVAAAQVPQFWNPAEGLDEFNQSWQTSKGVIAQLGPVVRMSKTPPRWRCPSPEAGVDAPHWLAI